MLPTPHSATVPKNLLALLSPATGSCHSTIIQTSLSISSASLEEVARLLGRVKHHLHSLSLSSLPPSLTHLPGWLLANISVSDLRIVRTGLKDVDESTFSNLEQTLTSLSIQDSRLTYVPRGINKISTLRSLDLEGNNITELYPYSFYGASITGLSLASNRLTSLTENAFLGLEGNLRDLNLAGNRIRHFPSSAVKNLQSLQTLNLGRYHTFASHFFHSKSFVYKILYSSVQ